MEQKKKVYLNPVQVITIALFLFFVFGVKVQAEQKYVEELKIDNVYIVLAGEVQDSSEFPQGVSYSEATNTLTLDNVNVEKVQGTGTADLNIIIKNTSIVQKDIFYGADSEEEKGGNINISGGKLQFTKELYGYARISTFEDDGVSVQGNINLLNMTIESNNGYNLLHTNKGNVSIKNCIIKMTNGSGNAIITQGDQAKISISNSSIETIYSSLANIYYTMMQPEITGMHCYVGEEKAEYEMNKNDFFKEYNYDYSPYIHHVNFAYVGKYTLLTTEDKHLPQAYRVSVDVDEISSAQVSRCYGIPGETISFQAKKQIGESVGYYTVNGKKVSGKSFVMPSDNVVISYKKSSGNNSTNQTIKVSKIFLSGISKQIAVGKKIKLTASVSPKNAVNKSVSWKSSNTKVATVSSSGWVTIKKKTGGKSVTITATAKDGSKKKATYVIKSMKGVVKKVSISGIKW